MTVMATRRPVHRRPQRRTTTPLAARSIPTLRQVVADLLRAGVVTWPAVLDVNRYELRVQWGHLQGWSPAPWCVHGRLLVAETCNLCVLEVTR